MGPGAHGVRRTLRPLRARLPRLAETRGRRPRTLVGGAAGPKLFAHIADYADGWMPIGGRGLTRNLPVLREAWERAGRDPKTLQVVPFAVLPDPGKLAHYAELGCEEVVVQLPPGEETEVLRALDGYAEYV